MFFFFFKQKTAYEMRISDWSSDVCSSDLLLSTIMSLGDFNSIYLLTGGGPADATQTLATLGIRYAFGMSEIEPGVSTVVVALPVMLPLLILMLRRMRREDGA